AELLEPSAEPRAHGPRLRPDLDGALGETQRVVGQHARLVELEHRAQPVARGARAERRVEREQAGLELLQRAVGVKRAGVLLGIDGVAPGGESRRLVALLARDDDRAVADAQRGLDRVGDALAALGVHDDAVDDRLDGVLLVATEVRGLSPASLSASRRSTIAPFTRARTKPCDWSDSRTSRWKPFFARTTGATIMRREPSGSDATASTICDALVARIGLPQRSRTSPFLPSFTGSQQ